jgi:hypothetical protein
LDIQNFVYMFDEEAVEKGMIEVWWFNKFGKLFGIILRRRRRI